MAKKKTDNQDLQAYLDIYQSYINYKIHEGELVWSRFSGFVVAHSVFYAIIGQIITSSLPNKSPYLILASTLGLILGGLWYISTIRGFESVEFWSNASVEYANYIYKNFGIPNLFERGEKYFKKDEQVQFQLGHNKITIQRSWITRWSVSTRGTAYLSILFFLLSYFGVILVTIVGWIK